jgi:hypothetical protein
VRVQEEFENLTEAAAAALGGAKASDHPKCLNPAERNSSCKDDDLKPPNKSSAVRNIGSDLDRPTSASAPEENGENCGNSSRPSDASAAGTAAASGGLDVLAGEVLFYSSL